jgi:hypothetical protein
LRNKMKDDINFLLVLGLIDNKMWIKLLDWAHQACAKRNQNYASLLISFLFCDSKTKITDLLKKCDNLTKATQLWRATFCRDNLAQATHNYKEQHSLERHYYVVHRKSNIVEKHAIMLYSVLPVIHWNHMRRKLSTLNTSVPWQQREVCAHAHLFHEDTARVKNSSKYRHGGAHLQTQKIVSRQRQLHLHKSGRAWGPEQNPHCHLLVLFFADSRF